MLRLPRRNIDLRDTLFPTPLLFLDIVILFSLYHIVCPIFLVLADNRINQDIVWMLSHIKIIDCKSATRILVYYMLLSAGVRSTVHGGCKNHMEVFQTSQISSITRATEDGVGGSGSRWLTSVLKIVTRDVPSRKRSVSLLRIVLDDSNEQTGDGTAQGAHNDCIGYSRRAECTVSSRLGGFRGAQRIYDVISAVAVPQFWHVRMDVTLVHAKFECVSRKYHGKLKECGGKIKHTNQ